MNKSLILCGALAAAGCAKKQPPVVAVVPTPAPTPLPTQAPIVIQSNEPPPPAMFQVAPDQPFAQQPTRRTRRANRVAQRPRVAAPLEDSQSEESPEQMMARSDARAIYNVLGEGLKQDQSPEVIEGRIAALSEMNAFYRQQRNNPTMMSQQKANSNVIMTDALIKLGNSRLELVSGSVSPELQSAEKMRLSIGFDRAEQLSRALP